MSPARLATIVRKELLEAARNRAVLFPVAIVTALSLALPFSIAFIVPAMSGRPLGNDSDLLRLSRILGAGAGLSPEARIQAFLLQQFLFLLLLTPTTGAMALAAHAIVGEKQARTLEPLLATPITTLELLVGKVLGSLIPTLAISAAGIALYFGGVAALAEPGVARAVLTPRTWVLVLLVTPLSALVSLQFTILVSSRVNDARTAQQFGVLIVLPLTAVLVAQFSGALWLGATALALAGVGLAVIWMLMAVLSVALFDREAILTRWR